MSYNNLPLFKYDSKQNIRTWKAYTDYTQDSTGRIHIFIEHGVLNGKISQKIRYVNSGKNIGKANETSIEEQAELEIGYLYTKQIDDGYVFNIEDYRLPVSPQLAHKYKDKCHTIKWPLSEHREPKDHYYASKKLNGIRCFIFIKNGKVVKFESRTRKLFKFFTHIADDLINYTYENELLDTSDLVLDGELFNKDVPFEILASLINSDNYVEVIDDATGKLWSTNDVQFHCYDIVDFNHIDDNFYDRFVDYFSLPITDNIHRVSSVRVTSEEEMILLARTWISEGYEGLMLRNGAASYEFGKRSLNLIKYKEMEQQEYEIVDIYLAANDSTKVMFTLKSDITETNFDCGLKGDKEANLQYFYNKQNYIGKYLTVDYQVLSIYNIPLFPVGVAVRDGKKVNGKFIPDV